MKELLNEYKEKVAKELELIDSIDKNNKNFNMYRGDLKLAILNFIEELEQANTEDELKSKWSSFYRNYIDILEKYINRFRNDLFSWHYESEEPVSHAGESFDLKKYLNYNVPYNLEKEISKLLSSDVIGPDSNDYLKIIRNRIKTASIKMLDLIIKNYAKDDTIFEVYDEILIKLRDDLAIKYMEGKLSVDEVIKYFKRQIELELINYKIRKFILEYISTINIDIYNKLNNLIFDKYSFWEFYYTEISSELHYQINKYLKETNPNILVQIIRHQERREVLRITSLLCPINYDNEINQLNSLIFEENIFWEILNNATVGNEYKDYLRRKRIIDSILEEDGLHQNLKKLLMDKEAFWQEYNKLSLGKRVGITIRRSLRRKRSNNNDNRY